MDHTMGLDNSKLVYEAARQGRLSRYREAEDTWQLDSFSLNVLSYMAVMTFDIGNAPSGNIPRCYTGGWEQIAEHLGLLVVTASRGGKPVSETDRSAQLRRRKATAKTRVSHAFSVLQKAGLLYRVRPPRFGLRAVYALTIGSENENDTIVRLASERFRQSED